MTDFGSAKVCRAPRIRNATEVSLIIAYSSVLSGLTVSFDIEGDISKLSSRSSEEVRRWDDMFMVNLGPYRTPEGEKAFSAGEYTANFISTDLEASNGVIHVIDALLLRPLPKEDG